MRSWLAVVVVALTGCRTILGIDDPILADDDPPPDAPKVPGAFETDRVAPLFCTAGMPSDPQCPINVIPLPNQVNSHLEYVVQPIGDTLRFTNIQLVAGPFGLLVDHPWFVAWPFGPGVPIPDPLDRYLGVRFNLPPYMAERLDDTFVTLPLGVTNLPISVTFDALGEYAPPPP